MEEVDQKKILKIRTYDWGLPLFFLALLAVFVFESISIYLQKSLPNKVLILSLLVFCMLAILFLFIVLIKKRDWKNITLDGDQNLIHFKNRTTEFTRSLNEFILKVDLEREDWGKDRSGKKSESITFALRLVPQDGQPEKEFYLFSILNHKKLYRHLQKLKFYFPNLEDDSLARLVLERTPQNRAPYLTHIYLILFIVQALSWNYLKSFFPQLSTGQYLALNAFVFLALPALLYPQSKFRDPEKEIWDLYRESKKNSISSLTETLKKRLVSATDEELLDLYMYFHTSEGKDDTLSRDYFSGSPNRDRLCELILGSKHQLKISVGDKMELIQWIEERIPKEVSKVDKI